MASALARLRSGASSAMPDLLNVATKTAGKVAAGSSVAQFIPTGSFVTDADGVRRYILSDEDVRKLKGIVGGMLKDSAGKPAVRVSRVDEAVVPAILGRFGLPLGLGLGAVFLLGRASVGRR